MKLDRLDSFDEEFGFNFWPAFADLMLSLVLILVVIVMIVRVFLTLETVSLDQVRRNQKILIDSLAKKFDSEVHRLPEDSFGISSAGAGSPDIYFQNEATVQRVRFSDQILFQSDRSELTPEGKKALRAFGGILRANMTGIKEIQIQGHADVDQSYLYPSNLHLAAWRAIAVFEFLRSEVGIDPTTHLMSATSFGEYKPVSRSGDAVGYDRQALEAANQNDALKDRNRRIEILLFYRLKS